MNLSMRIKIFKEMKTILHLFSNLEYKISATYVLDCTINYLLVCKNN